MSLLELFHGPNAGYVLELYERYRQNPDAVDPETRAFFERWTPPAEAAPPPPAAAVTPGQVATPVDIERIVGAAQLARSIRELGHLAAQIDPLGSPPPGDPDLQLEAHGLSEADLAALPASIVRGPCAEGAANALEAINRLREVYCGTIGYELDHVQVAEERDWLCEAIESRRFFYGFNAERKRDLLQRLTEVETFERFLHTTYVGQKRFSLEGCDMLVPMLDSIIRNAAVGGTREVVLGMAHRGRLNVLAHILGKPYAAILAEFKSASYDRGAAPSDKGNVGWAGDVKYHLGAQRTYRESGIESMPITLAPNPSHLEFVNPVVEGRARAAQEDRTQPGAPAQNEKASLAVLIHGDAAFSGQGVVAETLNLSRLRGYRTGGTLHIIINNQIGFTTDPADARSTLYASDLAKGFEIPIVHVNADDVIGCIAVARLAHAYRERFGKDFVIDLVGYRRWGHNEGDEPSFTQPRMYAIIAKHPTVREQWARTLIDEGVIGAEDAEALVAQVTDKLQAAKREADAREAEDRRPTPAPPGLARRTQTAVPAERLLALNAALLNRPGDFHLERRLERILERRRNLEDADQPLIDWGHAEALAFASILADGIPIRLSGQDSERGTFSHRHAVLHDVASGRTFTPLQNLPQARASFAIYNSPLSEMAVLGFEYGYSSHAPNTLVLWEAQFGDFANGAQVIIDQFIVSGRAKWNQRPALVLLLPHGYEGQGPEHSSARLERFLQLAADDNIRVANPTTAAQYFHLLRRQAALLTSDPRPLIVMTPKSLLRHPKAASSLRELAEGHFQRVIDDPTGPQRLREVTRLILCSGKVYVDLISTPETAEQRHIAVARVEELYSFPADELRAVINGYPRLREIVWVQEEPRNMGAWSYIAPRLRELLPPDLPLYYVGRPESATPAEGSLAEHLIEQARIIRQALSASLDTPVTLTINTQVDA
ncbi:2-oxoglutarate dehydrogenase E1 component [Kallotenue papyrolyticum]|uniref:2-oxoglutarate dehydrogenase E1 component n=1 Tax=Kallotenue papyrolyticum TaxID=1325125 RepID=UPI0004925A9D|nr:2-oxoglutarate dehydrogenase E1 component [Kallotenue papyrolyticum]